MSGYHKRIFETFPMDNIKRVDRPTTLIEDNKVKRVDERESGFNRADRGDFGPRLKEQRPRFVMKHPVSGALGQMQVFLRDIVDGIVAKQKAPLPEDPALVSLHIKELAYFLRSDAVGICKLPPYAVYTNSFPHGEPVECDHKYAIAILIDQDWRTSMASTGHDWISNSMSFMSYSASGFIAALWQNIYGGSDTPPGRIMPEITKWSFPPFCSGQDWEKCAGSVIACFILSWAQGSRQRSSPPTCLFFPINRLISGCRISVQNAKNAPGNARRARSALAKK